MSLQGKRLRHASTSYGYNARIFLVIYPGILVGSSSSHGENGGLQTDTEACRDDSGTITAHRGRRRRPLVRDSSIQTKYLPRQGSIDASGEETQEEQLILKPSRAPEELPRHRKMSRFRNFSNQISFSHSPDIPSCEKYLSSLQKRYRRVNQCLF
ncbi:hypothetical protein SK128_010110 [Halocaridina rubra]|uniref:Uncharacterized protein n=1 Tax=Halocaridina rubra TaxID=373956 RepID=A0AAN8ZXT8_HALRR